MHQGSVRLLDNSARAFWLAAHQSQSSQDAGFNKLEKIRAKPMTACLSRRAGSDGTLTGQGRHCELSVALNRVPGREVQNDGWGDRLAPNESLDKGSQPERQE